jgi:hypothetical protein
VNARSEVSGTMRGHHAGTTCHDTTRHPTAPERGVRNGRTRCRTRCPGTRCLARPPERGVWHVPRTRCLARHPGTSPGVRITSPERGVRNGPAGTIPERVPPNGVSGAFRRERRVWHLPDAASLPNEVSGTSAAGTSPGTRCLAPPRRAPPRRSEVSGTRCLAPSREVSPNEVSGTSPAHLPAGTRCRNEVSGTRCPGTRVWHLPGTSPALPLRGGSGDPCLLLVEADHARVARRRASDRAARPSTLAVPEQTRRAGGISRSRLMNELPQVLSKDS